MPEFRLRFKKEARKYLESVDSKTRTRLLAAIAKLAQFPPTGDIKPMSGIPGKYRLRVGSYRVLFSYGKDGEIIIVLVEDIGPRGDIYK